MRLQASQGGHRPPRGARRGHTSTFFKTLWEGTSPRDNTGGPDAGAARPNGHAANGSATLHSAQEPGASPRGAGDAAGTRPNGAYAAAAGADAGTGADARAGAADALQAAADQVAVEEHLLAHLQLTQSLQRCAQRSPRRQARPRGRAESYLAGASARRRQPSGPLLSGAESAPVDGALLDDCSRHASARLATQAGHGSNGTGGAEQPLLDAMKALCLSEEMQRRKARAEVEWCAKRWRSNARRMLAGEHTSATAGDAAEISQLLGKVGSVAVRALEAGGKQEDGA